ncbi:mucin-binding protein [Lactobacillus amylovorus]|uniref:YSIRK-type signal peptide-containing protein n=3 Tax=Lactobacillus amylovorus TaxID=1604 RepID=A0ABQ6P0R4_LACAM|nr:hypothetical protein LABF125_16580 [Lactobacillus amylovorus]
MRNRIVTAVKQRFSIRKLSIGAASVLLGTSLYFMGGSATIVHADTNVPGDAHQTETSNTPASAGVDGSSGQQKAPTNDKINESKLDSIARNNDNNDTAVNNAIDKYAQVKQEEVGDNALIRASDKEPTTIATTASQRGDQVDSIAKKLDQDVKNANQEAQKINDYKNAHPNTASGEGAQHFADQGLSIDDEPDSEINQITVDHNNKTLSKGQSETIDGIHITHTDKNKMTDKEKNVMKINSDNKVIVDFQHDQCDGKEITVTYENLKNSYYLENIDNKTDKIKISKIERTFSHIQEADKIRFTSDGHTPKGADGVYDECYGPQLIIYNDPSDGFFYNNITQVWVKDIYYDDQGSKINFDTKNDNNKAWIFVTSLNSNGGGNVEKVSAQGPNNSSVDVEKIAGSTVTNHNGLWYSDNNNNFGGNPDWDNRDEANRFGFVGTVAVQYHPGMTLQYSVEDWQWGSHWACTQTQVVSSLDTPVIIYDHIKDNVVPKEVTNKWNETIRYVIADDSSKAPKAPDDNVQYSNWGKTETIDQITGNTVEDGEYDTDWKLQPGEKKSYDEVPNEIINGYHTKDKSVAETPVIPGCIEKTVVYYPNGKIIPVDKNGNQIPGADQPVFRTDLSDPTKTVDGQIPVVKGYHPEKGKPGDWVAPKEGKPGDDVPVVYVEDDQLAQIIYRDDDDNDKVLATDDSSQFKGLSGKAGSEINYDPQSRIDQFINKGYELKNNGFPAGAVFDNDSNNTQTFYIDFIHGTTTVTPEKPGKPGEPINPKDPKGPKWPDGTDKASLTKTGTQTIHYVGAGDKTPADNTQPYTFSKSMVIDKVTGTVLDSGSWNVQSHTFGTVETPVIPGYQADKAVAGGATVTPDDLDKVITVTYTKIGTISVKYHDTTEDKDLKGYGTNAEGKENDPFTYDPASDLKELEGRGYVVDGEVPNIPNKFSDGPQTVVINVKHGTTPVDPEHPGAGYSATDLEKTITRTINYLDGEGNSVAPAHTDNFKFKASGTVDKVTGKLVSVDKQGNITGAGQLTWNAEDHEFDHVDSPTFPGMHVTNVTPADQKDGDNVKAVTVTKDSSDIVVNVYYAPNGTHQENAKTVPSTQTVKIVDDQGKELRPSIVDSFTFNRTPDVTDAEGKTTAGQWNATEYTYGTVDAPVIPGYVAEKGPCRWQEGYY